MASLTDTPADLQNHAARTPTQDARPALGWILTLGGVIGLASAAMLIIEKIHLLEQPNAALSCDLSAFVSCGGVINTDQASAFGFPNPLIGIVGFTIVLTVGVLTLTRTSLPRWFWWGLQAGVILGVAFVTWLQFQSIYRIEKLCPYCMVVWAVMIPVSIAVTAFNLRAAAPASRASAFLNNWSVLIGCLWAVAIGSAIWFQFGETLWA